MEREGGGEERIKGNGKNKDGKKAQTWTVIQDLPHGYGCMLSAWNKQLRHVTYDNMHLTCSLPYVYCVYPFLNLVDHCFKI